MACTLPGNSCAISASASRTRFSFYKHHQKSQALHYCVRVRASSEDAAEDCNTEECAPDKEVTFLNSFFFFSLIFFPGKKCLLYVKIRFLYGYVCGYRFVCKLISRIGRVQDSVGLEKNCVLIMFLVCL